MGKQSARLYYQGYDHKDIYYQHKYHDAIYKGNVLVWKKIYDWYVPFAGGFRKWLVNNYTSINVCGRLDLNSCETNAVYTGSGGDKNLPTSEYLITNDFVMEPYNGYISKDGSIFYQTDAGAGRGENEVLIADGMIIKNVVVEDGVIANPPRIEIYTVDKKLNVELCETISNSVPSAYSIVPVSASEGCPILIIKQNLGQDDTPYRYYIYVKGENVLTFDGNISYVYSNDEKVYMISYHYDDKSRQEYKIVKTYNVKMNTIATSTVPYVYEDVIYQKRFYKTVYRDGWFYCYAAEGIYKTKDFKSGVLVKEYADCQVRTVNSYDTNGYETMKITKSEFQSERFWKNVTEYCIKRGKITRNIGLMYQTSRYVYYIDNIFFNESEQNFCTLVVPDQESL